MPGWEVHENRNLQIRHEVEQKILEFVLFRAVQRELAEHDSAHLAQQSRGAEMEQPLVDDRHRIPGLLEKEDGVAGVDLVWGSDGLLHQREIAASQTAEGDTR